MRRGYCTGNDTIDPLVLQALNIENKSVSRLIDWASSGQSRTMDAMTQNNVWGGGGGGGAK